MYKCSRVVQETAKNRLKMAHVKCKTVKNFYKGMQKDIGIYVQYIRVISRTDPIFQAYKKRKRHKKKTAILREENEIPSIAVDSTRAYIFPPGICTSLSNGS